MVLWARFVNSINEGETYSFKAVRVKKDSLSHEIFLNKAKSGTQLEPTVSFTEWEAIAAEIPVDYYISTIQGEVVGIEKVAFYPACRKCRKILDATAAFVLAQQIKDCCRKHTGTLVNSPVLVQSDFCNGFMLNLFFDDSYRHMFHQGLYIC